MVGQEIGRDVRDRDGVARGLGDPEAEGAEQIAPVVAEDRDQRVLDKLALFLGQLELGRLLDLEPDVEAGTDQERAQQEGQAPGPVAGQSGGGKEGQVGQQQSEWEARLRDRGVLALLLPGRVLERHQDRAAPLGAERQALDHAHRDQQDRCPYPNLLIRRQQADHHRRDAHHQQRGDQHRAAADLVAEVAADDAAQRAGREADAERREREQGSGDRVGVGEERVTAVQRGGGAVPDEVEVLDRRAEPLPIATRSLCRVPSTGSPAFTSYVCSDIPTPSTGRSLTVGRLVLTIVLLTVRCWQGQIWDQSAPAQRKWAQTTATRRRRLSFGPSFRGRRGAARWGPRRGEAGRQVVWGSFIRAMTRLAASLMWPSRKVAPPATSPASIRSTIGR